jgi:hypothetical protein
LDSMFFAVPSAVFSEPGAGERIRGGSAESGRAGRSSRHFLAHQDQFVATQVSPHVSTADLQRRAGAIHRTDSDIQDGMSDERSADLGIRPGDDELCKLQRLAPRGETRLDGANNKTISLHAQGLTMRAPSECAPSIPRSWPSGHDPRSVYLATSPFHSRSQAVARSANPDARLGCNDLLAR